MSGGPNHPVPFPPAGEPSRTTPRGHIKAYYLTDQELEQIFANLDEGMSYQDACHAVGTSHLQFQRAARKRPQMAARLLEIKESRRQPKALPSEHGEPTGNDDT